ncbi:hypothetical protein A9Q74_00625 [Colwellia sp. 39_35_sub15_T18]|nr:hypothetical protein A9Q74_00625 [Colwellia sp. 39_35_sub15_T18]
MSERTRQQEKILHDWLDAHCGKKIVSIEIGAGTAIPSVRIARSNNTKSLIRINPAHYNVFKGQNTIPIKMSALSALTEIDKLLS